MNEHYYIGLGIHKKSTTHQPSRAGQWSLCRPLDSYLSWMSLLLRLGAARS